MRHIRHAVWTFANWYGFLTGWPFLAPVHRTLLLLSLHGLGYDNALYPSFSGETSFVRSILKKLDISVCIDVGAHIGRYTRLVASSFPHATIYAIEPNPRSFSLLEKTASLFPKGTIIPIHSAVSNTEGTATLYAKSPLAETATLEPSLLSTHTVEETVEVTTLDALQKKLGISRVDFIKIDTEGFEREVLLGAHNILTTLKPKCIQFEFNILHLQRGYTVYDLSCLLKEHTLFRLIPHGVLRVNPQQLVNNVFAFSNVIAVRNDLVPSISELR